MESRSSAGRLPVLAQVTTPLRCVAPRIASLPHVADIISRYLDRSVFLTPAQAAAREATRLLDRVLTRVMHDPSVDEVFRDHWLARAMEVVIEKNSLAMVQQIHRIHPEPLVVRSLQLALTHGTLEMAKWIVENRNDRFCCAPGVQNICASCLNSNLPGSITEHDTEAILDWLVSIGASASSLNANVMSGCFITNLRRNLKVARWLDARGQLHTDGLVAEITSGGPPEAIDTLVYLIEHGHSIADDRLVGALVRGACQRELEPLVDVVVASRLCDSIRDKFVWAPTRAGGAKVLHWKADFLINERVPARDTLALTMANDAATFCHLDTLKWLWYERGVAPETAHYRRPQSVHDLVPMYTWMIDAGVGRWFSDDRACAAYLPALQWLHAHKPNEFTPWAMNSAAEHGHLETVQWLHAHRTEGCTDYALTQAAGNGHFEVVKWLTANRSEGDANDAMVTAVMNGQLEALEWIHKTRDDACGVCVLRSLLVWVRPLQLGRSAAVLDPIRWLTSHGARSVSCVGRCVPEPRLLGLQRWSAPGLAISQGDVALAKYFLSHHRASFSVEPLALVVQGGHLPAIQWLFAAAPETVNWQQVLQSARDAKNEPLVAWLKSTHTDHE